MMETESGPASAVTAPSQTAALSQEDEDSELKDLVTQTLQSAGILGKIKVSLYYMYVQVFHFSEKKSGNPFSLCSRQVLLLKSS